MKSIRTKATLYKHFLKNLSVAVEKTYKSFKNKLNHLIRIAKRNFYDHKLAASKNDIKTRWKILNEVLNKRKSKLTYPPVLKVMASLSQIPLLLLPVLASIFLTLVQI